MYQDQEVAAMGKLVFHVDVNSAFLSWEAARRVANGEQDIRLLPSVIGGDREKRTGVVLAKSIPATSPASRSAWHSVNARIFLWQNQTSGSMKKTQENSWTYAVSMLRL